MAKPLPPLGRLADLLLKDEGGLAAFIESHRSADPPRSWDWIAREISVRTNRQIDATDVTVQSWAERLDQTKAAS